MKQVIDFGVIEVVVDEIIVVNLVQVEKVKVNFKLVGWFVGQVLKVIGGKVNLVVVQDLVVRKLGQ